MGNNYFTPWGTNTRFDPADLNVALMALDKAITYIKRPIIHCDGDISWDKSSGSLTWGGILRMLFTNDAGNLVQNVVAVGNIVLADNECAYVDLNETDGTTLTVGKIAISTNATSTIKSFNRILLGYRNSTSDEFYPVSLPFKASAAATSTRNVALKTGVTAQTGNLLCLTSTGYALADCTDLAKLQDVVYCKTGGTITAVIIESGIIDGGSFTAGGAIYVGAAGAITQTAPTTANYFVKCIGYATTSTQMKFAPDSVAIQLPS